MQTFLPYADFKETAKCLDYRRLGKQRVEAMQMIDAIEGRKTGWINHPCTKMWKNHVDALKLYFDMISYEWVSRGYKHNLGFYVPADTIQMPKFIGDEDFHSRHRAALLHKDYEYYKQFNWKEEPRLDYTWPEG